jgi:hypothetical protein
MSKHPSRDIICAECPGIYSEYEIKATRGDESRPLVEVLGRSPASNGGADNGVGKKLGRLFGKEARAAAGAAPVPPSTSSLQRDKLRNLNRLKDWTFTCPRGHQVDGNRGYQIPLAVIGASGSSKSHFLPGMIWETDLMRALSPLGVTLRPGQFTSAQLSYAVRQLYQEKKILPPTPPDAVAGPFGYRLSIRDKGEELRNSLLLFDVGGEALSSIVKISEQAAFVLLAQGIIVLIDPQYVVSTEFDTIDAGIVERERVIAAANVRNSITLMADALEELWDSSMRQIPIPVCFVVAKADSLSWSYDWASETSKVIKGTDMGRELRELLLESSDRVRAEFGTFGGGLILEEVDERFSPGLVRFAAASATCEMPTDGSWVNPTPAGISLALLHVLDMLGKIHINSTPTATLTPVTDTFIPGFHLDESADFE